MPASLTRTEYYWINDRLVQVQNHRSSVYSRWAPKRAYDILVATIEDRGKSKKIEHGMAATSSRIAQVLLRDQRLQADPTTPDIGVDVPKLLIQQSATVVQNAISEVTRQFSRLAKEERITGALQFELNRYGVIEYEGWQLSIVLQGFTEKPKEKKTGADVGIIIDLIHDSKQVSKGLWVQAKQSDAMPEDPLTLPDMKRQMADMLSRTTEAFGIVYTPSDVVMFQGGNSQKRTTLEEVIGEVAACRRGDRNPEFLADTIHRDYLIELAFESTRSRHYSDAMFEWAKEGF